MLSNLPEESGFCSKQEQQRKLQKELSASQDFLKFLYYQKSKQISQQASLINKTKKLAFILFISLSEIRIIIRSVGKQHSSKT